MTLTHDTRGELVWRVYCSADKGFLKVPDVKRWVGDYCGEFGSPPPVARLHAKNDRLIDHLTTLGVGGVITTNGVLGWELHLALPRGQSE